MRGGGRTGARRFVVLMGAPGAGKGTQADRLAAALGACKLSTGDLLREAIRAGTPVGRAAEATMARGALVADDVILELVRDELATARCSGGAVLDGFPRTLPQAEGLDRLLNASGERIEHTLFLDVHEEEVVRRLSSRRICEGCGRLQRPAADGATCESCGGRLVQRPDDRPETIRHRMEVFRRDTAPLLECYRERGLLREVDGGGEVDRVHALVLEAL